MKRLIKGSIALCLSAQIFGVVAEPEGAVTGKSPAQQLTAPNNVSVAEMVPGAHEVVKQVTDQVLAVIQKNRDTLDKKPDQYYADIQAVLDPVVDFRFIARAVMGSFGKSATAEQRKRFAEIFKNSLVTTYAKGIAGFGNQKIVVLPPKKGTVNSCAMHVQQEVQGGSGVDKVSYTMRRKKLHKGDKHCTGDWKLVNVIFNGISLGSTFHGQFAQAMQQVHKKNGKNSTMSKNLDIVIDNWAAAAK